MKLDGKMAYPQWFIDELVAEEDNEKAKNGLLLSKNRVKFKCKNGHEYEQVVSMHIRNGKPLYGCKLCSRIENVKYLEKQIEKLKEKRSYSQWFIDELINEEDKIRARNGSLTSKDKSWYIFGVPLFLFSGFQHSIANSIIMGTSKSFSLVLLLYILGNLIGALFIWFFSKDTMIFKIKF